jgi:transglutaminase-like putative cysteine protease
MRRTLLGALPPLVAIGLAWDGIEQPGRSGLIVLAAVASVLPALARSAWSRLGLALALVVGVTCASGAAWPWETMRILVDGTRDAAVVASPYAPAAHGSLHVTVTLVVALCGLATSLSIASRRPLLAGAIAAVAIAWPATLADGDPVVWGCVALGAALWPTIALGAATRQMLVGGVAAAAVVLAGSALAAERVAPPGEARIDWRGWSPLGGDGARVGVRYVWDASYDGITFPSEPTVVCRVRATERALYWRASTLDTFLGDRWIENLYPRQISPPRRVLPADPLLPPAARRSAEWVKQEIVVEALDEDRLVAVSQPMQIASDGFERAYFLSGGVISAEDRLTRRDTYTIWSYAPSPTPRQLAASPARYPVAVGRYLELGRARMPPFGTPGRAVAVERVLADERYPDIAPYRGLWREAHRLAGETGSPYVATLAIERWLRSGGGFVYDERPATPPVGVPPLAHFAATGRAGYCQHFAGTMAVMLRFLGIPSRVAVGFSSGRRSDDEWVVTDHDAHAWVEVWLAGHGWLAFDPTPGRGTLSASYTLASDSADAVRALGTGRFLDFEPDSAPAVPTGPVEPTVDETATARRLPVLAVLTLALPLGVAVVVVGSKALRRRRRLTGDDPRDVAAGVRLELADILRDHGVGVRRGASMAELGWAASRTLGVPSDRLVAVVDEARYAPVSQARRAADGARRELAALLAASRRRVGLRRRLVAAVHVRSLRAGLDRPGTMRG